MSLYKQEWRMMMSGSFVSLFIAVFIGLMIYSGESGKSYVSKYSLSTADLAKKRTAFLDSLQQAAIKQEAKLDSLGKPKSPPGWGIRNAYWANLRANEIATLPLSPLAGFSIGQSDIQNREIPVQVSPRFNPYNDKPELESPLKLFTGRFDAAFLIIYFLPLLIIALSFGVLTGEKERGMLALILSQSTPLESILKAKLLLRAALVVGVSLLTGIVVWGILGVSFDFESLMKLLILATGLTLYCGFWFSLALLVNLKGKSSAGNALILAACWLLFLVIVPSALNSLSNAMYPLPSRVAYVSKTREVGKEAEARAAKRMEKFLFDHPELSKDSTAKEDFAIEAFLVVEDITQTLEPLSNDFQSQKLKQASLINVLQILSPPVVMQNLLNTLSGTDAERHTDFIKQVKAFHKEWKSHLEQIVFARKSFTAYTELPRFQYQEESFETLINRVSHSLLLILIPTGLIGLYAARRVRSYQVV